MLKYTEDHEWLREQDGEITVGITRHASEQLGDVVFIELPETGRKVEAGEEIVVIESVKAASEIYAPASGDVTEGNQDLDGAPGKVNEDATGEGWLFKMTLNDPTELNDMMDAGAYKEFVEDLG